MKKGLIIGSGGEAPKDLTYLNTIASGDSYINTLCASPDGTSVYLTSAYDANVYSYSRNVLTGTLTLIDTFIPPSPVLGMTSIAISPDGLFVYIGEAGNYPSAVPGKINTYSRNATTGILTFISATSPFLTQYTGLVISPDGKNLYGCGTTNIQVTVYSRNLSTGALTFVTTVNGSGWVDGVIYPLVLTMSPDGKNIYAAMEVGTTARIDVFNRDISTGALTVGSIYTLSGGGRGTGCVTVSPDGSSVYASGYAADKVFMFSRASDGTLTALSPASITTDGRPKIIAASYDGKRIYVACTTGNVIDIFDRDVSTGVLTANSQGSVAAPSSPNTVIVTADGRNAYVNASSNILEYTRTLQSVTAGNLYPVMAPLPARDVYSNSSTIDSAISPEGLFVYTVSLTTDTVITYSRNPTTNVLTKITSNAAGVQPYDICISPDGTGLYVLNINSSAQGSISQYTRNTTTGALTSLGNFSLSASGGAAGICISPDGLFLYQTAQGSQGVFVFSRNTSTNLLSSSSNLVVGNAPRGICVSPDGATVYINDQATNLVYTLTRNTSTGALTNSGSIACGSGAYDIIVSPDGTSVYSSNGGSNTIFCYVRNTSTGALSSATTVSTGNTPFGLAISADGTEVVCANYSDATVGVYTRNTSTGALSLAQTIKTAPQCYNVAVSLDQTAVYATCSSGTVLSCFNIVHIPTISGAGVTSQTSTTATVQINSSNSATYPNLTYTVTASPGAISASSTTNTVTVTGLTNGVTYTFTCTVTNSVGTSSPVVATPFYAINNSLRFRASNNGYLTRTPASAGNQQTWTWSGWVKSGYVPHQVLFNNDSGGGGSGALGGAGLTLEASGGRLQFSNAIWASYHLAWYSTVNFKDPSAWYHIVMVWDSTQASSSNAVKMYINGVQNTCSFSAFGGSYTQNMPSLVNSANPFYLATAYSPGVNSLDGYMAEVNFIDGQALTPSSFGVIDGGTGDWRPIAYTGTYGTNGFYLPFSDTSALTSGSNAGLGKDFSGNGNFWNTNGISITAGSTYDAMTDSPTLSSTSIGNYATLNPLATVPGYPTPTLSNGNLKGTAAAVGSNYGTVAISSGKWYWEAVVISNGSDNMNFGIRKTDFSIWSGAALYPVGSSSLIINSSAFQSGLSSIGSCIVAIAVDLDNLNLQVYVNGSAFGSLITGISPGQYYPNFDLNASSGTNSASVNFGQQPFTYTPPAGFSPLNATNIAAGSVTTSGTFTGNASATGPFVWLNGAPSALSINGNPVTWGTHAIKTAGGFQVITSSASYNAAGSNTYTVTANTGVFKYNDAQTNP